MPIGTGRYKITNISSNNVTLAKFDKWKSTTGVTELKLDNIKINLYSSMGEVYNSFKIGNIDLIKHIKSKFPRVHWYNWI